MLDFIYGLTVQYEKIKGIFSNELLTLVILFSMLFRKKIVNSITSFVLKSFNVKENETTKRNIKFVQNYIIILGVYLLFLIWFKDVNFIDKFTKFFRVVTIITITRLIAILVKPEGIVSKVMSQKGDSSSDRSAPIINFIYSVFVAITYFIGGVIVLAEFGYNLNGVVAGLGISTAFISLSLQDFLKSIISGATIMTEKPFKIGDIIEGDSYSGVVENITLRTIKIRTDDNSVINVPNLKITTECVTNISEIDNRRFNLSIYISYGIKIEKVRRVMDKVRLFLENNEKVLTETIAIKFEEIAKEGMKITINCYIDEAKKPRFLVVKERINFEIMKVLEAEGIELYTNNIRIKNFDPEMLNGRKNEEKKLATKTFRTLGLAGFQAH